MPVVDFEDMTLTLSDEQRYVLFKTDPTDPAKTRQIFDADVAVFDVDGTPKTTIWRRASSYTCMVEVAGLAATRAPSLEENVHLGIRSFDPPTVFVKRTRNSTADLRRLIDMSVRAVQSASTSTTGETGGPGTLVMIVCHVTRGVRGALRYLGEDI